jgi:hypothetical protein
MIEIYAFFAMFTLQILGLSVVFPARFIQYTRAKAAEYPAEAFASLYPGVDPLVATEKLLARFRIAHGIIAVAGFVLLGWMVANAPPLTGVKMMIFPLSFLMLQMLPMLFLAVTGFRQIAMLRSVSVERKRKAVLQPRGLFDLISPLRAAVEVAIYVAFVAFVLYLMYVVAKPIPASLGYPLIGAATAGLVLQAAFLYWRLRGRKVPLESPADRMRTTGVQAKHSVYGTLATVVFMSLVILLPRLGLQDWLPFALSTFLVFVALQFCVSVTLPPRSHPAH